MEKVSVIGLGYVGLPLAVAIEESKKYEVLGFDVDRSKIEKIKAKISPIVDKELENRLKKVDLGVTIDEEDLKGSDYFIIAVPTPINKDYEPDLNILSSAVKMVSKHLKKGSMVVIESTINPGVCDEILIPIIEKETKSKVGKDFELAHCPERINPGDKKWTVYNIPRNVGATTESGTKKIADFYRSFLDTEINEVSSVRIAEATKIIENTFRDINIAYVNELAKSFDAMGVDLVETIEGASNKPFGFMPHWPGAGVGGHCIAVDPYYLIKRGAKSGFDHKFLKLARNINNSMPKYLIDKLVLNLNELSKSVKGTKILLYGLSYKPEVGDMRESPALEIKAHLEKLGAELEVFDPYLKDYSTVESLDEGIEKSDVLVIATAHSELKNLDIKKMKNLILILDGRNCLDIDEINKNKINYSGIGR